MSTTVDLSSRFGGNGASNRCGFNFKPSDQVIHQIATILMGSGNVLDYGVTLGAYALGGMVGIVLSGPLFHSVEVVRTTSKAAALVGHTGGLVLKGCMGSLANQIEGLTTHPAPYPLGDYLFSSGVTYEQILK